MEGFNQRSERNWFLKVDIWLKLLQNDLSPILKYDIVNWSREVFFWCDWGHCVTKEDGFCFRNWKLSNKRANFKMKTLQVLYSPWVGLKKIFNPYIIVRSTLTAVTRMAREDPMWAPSVFTDKRDKEKLRWEVRNIYRECPWKSIFTILRRGAWAWNWNVWMVAHLNILVPRHYHPSLLTLCLLQGNMARCWL